MESDNGMVEGRTAIQTLVFEEFKVIWNEDVLLY